MFDGKAFGKEIVDVVKAHVEKTVAPLLSQIETLKAEVDALKPKQIDPAEIDRKIEAFSASLKQEREAAKAEAREKRKAAVTDLKAGILAECETMFAAKIAEAIETAKPEPVDVKALVDEALTSKVEPEFAALAEELQAVKAMVVDPELTPTRADVAKQIAEAVEAIKPELGELVADAIDALPPAENGKDADPELMASMVKETVERAVAAIPVPPAAEPLTADDVRPMVEELVAKVAADIPVPKDGRDGFDGVEFLRNADGHLLVTMSNGTVRDLGEIVGKDGRDGKDADMAAIESKLAAIPDAPDVDLSVVTRMIEDAVAKHTVEPMDFAPDDVAANVALAVKMMAETPQTQARQEAQPINVYSNVTMPEMKAADTVVNVTVPEQAAPVVNIDAPVHVATPNVIIEAKRTKERTTVTDWDKSGRIKSFEKTEIDE